MIWRVPDMNRAICLFLLFLIATTLFFAGSDYKSKLGYSEFGGYLLGIIFKETSQDIHRVMGIEIILQTIECSEDLL